MDGNGVCVCVTYDFSMSKLENSMSNLENSMSNLENSGGWI